MTSGTLQPNEATETAVAVSQSNVCRVHAQTRLGAETAAKLKPKEHGAYAILGIPIVASLLIAGATVVGACVAAASIAGFMAHEPLVVALGHRGTRAQRTTPAAKQRTMTLVGVMILCGSTAMAFGSNHVRLSLVVCLLMAVVSFTIAIAGRHRTLGGQLLGVIGLSVPCVPVLLAGSISPNLAMQLWAVWLIGFTSTTMAVRGVIAAQKRSSRLTYWAAILTLMALSGGLTFAGYPVAIVLAPMLVMSLLLLIYPPPAKQIKRVGWALVVGTVATAAWMVTIA
ncbi:MAG: YwiC-like family protein [Rubripirellula sp.]